MAVNYGLLEPVNIAGQFMAGRQQAQQNQLAQQQAEMRQQEFGMRKQEFDAQAEERRLKLADYKTKQAGLDKFLELSVANGKTGSPKEMASSFYEYAITQRDPQLIMSAQTMMQAADDREKYDAILKRQQTISAQQAPAPMAGDLGTGTFGIDNIPGMPNALASRAAPMVSTNALAPTPAAPMAADPVAAIDSEIALYENLRDPRAKDKITRLQKQRDELTKRYTVGNTLMNQMGDVVGTAPAAAKTIGTVNPSDFTSASVANFNRSGNYGDLVLKPVDRAPRPEAAPRTQQISLDDGSLGIVNMDTGVITRSTIDGAPASKNTLKPLPVHAQKSITGGAAALSKLDETIKSVEAADATGFKGFLPDVLLNRADPKGTIARANITDIGSLVLHDRSGATITASETPRLLPFIPSIKDDKPTTLKKLKRMRDIQAEELEALQGTYTRDQGYREFKVPEKAVPGVDGAPPAGVDAALWNVMTPEERKLWKK